MAKLDRLGWVVCSWYEIGGYRFGVRTTSRAFGDWMEDCLAAYRVDGPLDDEADPMWAVVVQEDGGAGRGAGRRFHILYRGTWDVVRTLDIRTVAKAFLTEMASITQPVRDDAVFLEGGVASASGINVLVPNEVVPGLARAVRRVQRAGIVAPGSMVVALDPRTGRLIAPDQLLEIPTDPLERLDDSVLESDSDRRIFIDDELQVDAVLIWGRSGGRGLFHASRAETLKALVGSVRNLRLVGGRGVEGLARLVSGATCYGAEWGTSNDVIESLAQIGGTYTAIDRSEDTQVGP